MAEEIFSNSKSIIEEILERIIGCIQVATLYVYGDIGKRLNRLAHIVDITVLQCLENQLEGMIYVECQDREDFAAVWPWMSENRGRADIFCYIRNAEGITNVSDQCYNLQDFSDVEGKVFLIGRTFDEGCVLDYKAPDFKVLAIMHTYNEADILEKTVLYLLDQEVDVYIADNWSDDGTYEIALALEKKFSGRIYVERFPKSGKTEFYEWYNQLERTEDISKSMSYNWFIHYDADEMRISPWKNVTLRQAIGYIDSLGYNLIENTVIDFKLTDESLNNIFMTDTYFDFGHRLTHFTQTKSWKKVDSIKLKDSGGHNAVVPDPRVYPLKILNRHYPFRNFEQAKRKVFRDRKPRFVREREERGWHGHYDRFQDEGGLITDCAGLLKWDETTFYKYYVPLFLGCGIAVENGGSLQAISLRNKRLVIFGAGKFGKWLYQEYQKNNKIVGWVDNNYSRISKVFSEIISPPESLIQLDFDYVVVAVKSEKVQKEMMLQLEELGIQEGMIICIKNY